MMVDDNNFGPSICIKLAALFLLLTIALSSLIIFNHPRQLLLLILIPFLCFFITIIFSDFVRCCLWTLPRDIKGFFRLNRLQREMDRRWAEDKSIGDHFRHIVNAHPQKVAIIQAETGRKINFDELDELANQYANYFGDEMFHPIKRPMEKCRPLVFGLFLENSIEFVAIWLGLSRIGIVTTWINSQLRGDSLAHSIGVAKCQGIITSPELLPALKTGLAEKEMKIYLINGQDEGEIVENCQLIVRPIKANELGNKAEPFYNGPKIGFRTILAYLYTSGTTGQPKAVIIRHYRYYFMGIGGRIIYGIRPADCLYCTLPMYHGMAGIAGIGQMIVNGCTIVIRKKFSAAHFWSDCVLYGCTVAIYIGEICRYLLAQPKCENERRHRIRLLCGLGMRPGIWRKFVHRFGITQVGELYGATEGNATCVNINYRIGAVGFLPIYTALMSKTAIRLVKIDPISGEYLRHKNGICVLCKPGETGEIVGMIRTDNPTRRFEGYLNKAETEKKIIRNVETVGDCAFSSGDILHWDQYGYLYFRDRRGDTFRWKGENVSSSEVENVIQDMEEIVDLAVYGVEVPGEEGKAGMCALALRENADKKILLGKIAVKFYQNLAPFAIPQFLRICHRLERTGTFKLMKANLQTQGICWNKKEEEAIFRWNPKILEFVEVEEI